MASFDKLRYLFERIIRERAFEPAQLDGLLSAQFRKLPDNFPDHHHYNAVLADIEVLQSCDLRSPKSEATQYAFLTLKAKSREITPTDIHRAYGESVRSKPACPLLVSKDDHYLSVMFDHVELFFGFDQNQKFLNSVIVEFDLG